MNKKEVDKQGFKWEDAEYLKEGSKRWIAYLPGVAVAMLAVMGLVFCWNCPVWPHAMAVVDPHGAFKHQLAWNAIGFSAFVLAVMLGWKRWLKAAPFVAVGWIVACIVAFHSPSVNGDVILWLGSVRVEVFAFLPFVAALLMAWLSAKFNIRAFPLFICTAIAALAVVSVKTMSNPNRMARVAMFFNGEVPDGASATQIAAAFVQEQCRAAFAAAQWFSGGDVSQLAIPGRHTFAMSASAALLFGKWFVAVMWFLFGGFAWCASCCHMGTRDEAKKSFALVIGLGMFGMAANSYLGCLGIVPMVYKTVPLVSYSGMLALMAWLSVGALVSMIRDGDIALTMKWRGIASAAVCGAGAIALIMLMR